eukprot:gene6633-8205_t
MSQFKLIPPGHKEKVYLNVYDLHPSIGAFHSGVEVYGVEYSFGGHEFSFSGVFEIEPKTANGVIFRESILIGETNHSYNQVQSIIDKISEEFSGLSYHPLQKNCNSFSDEFVKRLLNKNIPNYINRLAHIGNMFSCFLPTSLGLTNLPSSNNQKSTTENHLIKGGGSSASSPLFPGKGYRLSD